MAVEEYDGQPEYGFKQDGSHEIPPPHADIERRARALKLAREYVAATKSKDRYDKSLNASNRLAEELRIARFLLSDEA
jgi:hypothetical protein